MSRSCSMSFACALLAFFAASAAAGPESLEVPATPARPADPRIRDLLGRLPLSFEVNRGQAPDAFDFQVRCRGYRAFVAPDAVVFSFEGEGLRMSLDGARRVAPETRGLALPGHVNYFVGNDPAKWITEIPTTRGAVYRDAAPGTTWRFGSSGRALEFEFDLVAGAAGPRLAFEGAETITLADDGSLRLAMPHGVARISAPVAWQDVPGARVDAAAKWVVGKDGAVRIDVSPRDPNRGVRIDPSVTYESYLGGGDGDQCLAAAMDASRSAYLTGTTDSSTFPTALGAFSGTKSGGGDAFVTKVNPSGSALTYSTYIGSSATGDAMQSILVDGNGVAYFAGITYSYNYPTTSGVYRPGGSASGAQGVMSALSASGSSLVFSTYVQGYPAAIAFGPSGSLYVADSVGIARYAAGATSQLFYRQLMPTGPQPNGGFEVRGLASDSAGYAYVGGATNWYFPTTTGAFQTANSGDRDAFVAKLDKDGATVYSTWLGAVGGDTIEALGVNLAGQVYACGYTTSSSFPVTSGALRSTKSAPTATDAFVSRFDASGSSLRYSTYLGDAYAYEVQVHPGASFVVGMVTGASNLNVTNGFQTTPGGSGDGYVISFNRDNTLAWASYCGGSLSDGVYALGMAPDGTVVVGGVTSSTDFPTASPFQSSAHGGYECFMVSVPDTLPTVTPLAVASASLPTWTVNYPYSQTLQPSGGLAAYTWSLLTGSVPVGTLLTQTGVIVGTPTQTGTFTFTVRCNDACEMQADRTLSIRINPPPSIASPNMPGATVDTAYDRPVAVADGSGVMTFTLTAGSPPPGLTLGSDGRLTGTPTAVGTGSFTVRVVDGLGATGSGDVSVRVNPLPLVVATAIAECTETRPYTAHFQGTGGTTPYTWSFVSGTLPTSAPIDATLGKITGTAKSAAAYDFTLRITDAAGATAERAFSCVINPLPEISAALLPPAAVGRPYAATFGRTGGTAPFQWAVESGELPGGMALAEASGTVSGMPTSEFGGDVIVRCTDACGASTALGTIVKASLGADLTRRKSSEKLAFTAGVPAIARRFVEVTAGSLLAVDFSVKGKTPADPAVRVFDASGTEIDASLWTRSARNSVKVSGLPIPATGRYFVTASATAGADRDAKLTISIVPRARWTSGATLDPAAPVEYAFSAPPGAKLAISAKAGKGSAALPHIVSVIAPDGTDLVPGGKSSEKGGAAAFATKVPLTGGDYRVTFSTRDANLGPATWTVSLGLPKSYGFAMTDVPAGQ